MPDTGPYYDPKPTQAPGWEPIIAPPEWTGPYMQPTAAPTPKPPDWFSRQPAVIQTLIGALLGVLIQTLTQWGVPILRPPATDVAPTAPVAIQAQRGQAAAAALVDFGLLEE
jgi:hypothetical protein